MMTVHEVSQITGVSIRALHHYDRIGLLRPGAVTEAGYRLYGGPELERLQYILLFKELEFPLKEIRTILDSPDFDRDLALDQQITLLQMKKMHLEDLINLACGIKTIGVKNLDFTAFDTKQINEYAKQAKEAWEKTMEYQEYEEKSEGRTLGEEQRMGVELMAILVQLGRMKESEPADKEVQVQVKKLQDYITEHYYTCSDETLSGLGSMYGSGGRFTENIDKAGGPGTAEFAARAIEAYCTRQA